VRNCAGAVVGVWNEELEYPEFVFYGRVALTVPRVEVTALGMFI
jgi:hypothetical protein